MNGFDLRPVITVHTATRFRVCQRGQETVLGFVSFVRRAGNSAGVPGQHHASCRNAGGFHSRKHQSILFVHSTRYPRGEGNCRSARFLSVFPGLVARSALRPVEGRDVGQANITSQHGRGFPVYLETTIRKGTRRLARTFRPQREPQSTITEPPLRTAWFTVVTCSNHLV